MNKIDLVIEATAKAFSTQCTDLIGGVHSIVFAKTRGQAKYTTWQTANEAGYHVVFGDIRVIRAREFDYATMKGGGIPGARLCLDPDYLVPIDQKPLN